MRPTTLALEEEDSRLRIGKVPAGRRRQQETLEQQSTREAYATLIQRDPTQYGHDSQDQSQHGTSAPVRSGTSSDVHFSSSSSIIGAEQIPPKRRRREPAITNGYTCDFVGCPQTFDTSSAMRKHAVKHRPDEHARHKCPSCDKTFRYPKDVRRHFASRHQERVFTTIDSAASGDTFGHTAARSPAHASTSRRSRNVFEPGRVFQPGRVFHMVLDENAGADTAKTGNGYWQRTGHSSGRASFKKPARFVVIVRRDKYCLAMPITTYTGRCVAKRRELPTNHAILHTSEKPSAPLRVSSHGHELKPRSRLDHGTQRSGFRQASQDSAARQELRHSNYGGQEAPDRTMETSQLDRRNVRCTDSARRMMPSDGEDEDARMPLVTSAAFSVSVFVLEAMARRFFWKLYHALAGCRLSIARIRVRVPTTV